MNDLIQPPTFCVGTTLQRQQKIAEHGHQNRLRCYARRGVQVVLTGLILHRLRLARHGKLHKIHMGGKQQLARFRERTNTADGRVNVDSLSVTNNSSQECGPSHSSPSTLIRFASAITFVFLASKHFTLASSGASILTPCVVPTRTRQSRRSRHPPHRRGNTPQQIRSVPSCRNHRPHCRPKRRSFRPQRRLFSPT